MFGLSLSAPVTAALILASGATTCGAEKDFRTYVNLVRTMPDVVYDTTRTKKYLTENHQQIIDNWKSKHEDHVWASEELHIGGLARGGIGVSAQVKMRGEHLDRYGIYWCPYVERVDIEIFYATTIFIPKETMKNACEVALVNKHELGHHEINLGVVNKYAAKLRKDLNYMVAYLEKDYVKRHELKKRFREVQTGLSDAIEVYGAYMRQDMEKLNGHHDRPEEYERMARETLKCYQK